MSHSEETISGETQSNELIPRVGQYKLCVAKYSKNLKEENTYGGKLTR